MSRRLLRWLLLAAILTMLSCTMAAGAEETRSTPVRVAMLNYPNFIALDENGQASGFSCDYLDEIARYTGWDYEYLPMSFTEAQDKLAAGEIDIMTGTQFTEERAARYDFSDVGMAEDSNVLCVPADNTDFCYNDLAALEGKRIGYMTGSIRKAQFEETLAAAGVHVTFVAFDTDREERAALESGDVIAILMTSLRCTTDYRIIAADHFSQVYFTCNPHDPAIKAGIDDAQKQILAADPYYSLRLTEKHYGNVPRAYAFTDEERAYMSTAPSFTVAVSPDQRPTEYFNEADGSFHGLVVDYFSRISEMTGLRFRFVSRSDSEATLKAMQDGSLQIIASVAEQANVEDTFPVSLTDGYYQNSVMIAYNSGVQDPLASDCSIALRKSFVFYQSLAEAHGYTKLRFYDTLEQCVEAVNNGSVDLTYLPGFSTELVTAHAYYRNVTLIPTAVTEYGCAIAVSDSCDPMVVAILEKALAAIPSAEKEKMLLNALSHSGNERTFLDMFYENLTLLLSVAVLLGVGVGLLGFHSAARRKRINLRLTAAMDSAQRANAAKSDFLSRMSHDMRTPMNGIIGLTALTADLPGLPPEAKENLAAIDDSSRYLLNLINEVLDMNKIESNKLTLHEEIIPSESFIKNVIASVEPLAEQKHIRLDYQAVKLRTEQIRGDRVRLQQIFVNILSNAVKFTPEGGTVRINMERLNTEDDHADIRVSIADTGIGMSASYLPHLFEPFSQEGRTARMNDSGTGLGMSIVKKLVTLMGGRIEAESHVNAGTTITVYLSFPCQAAAEHPAAPAENPSDACLIGRRVLLVEDHPLNRKIAVKLLEKKQIIVDCAENGQEGLLAFTSSPPGTFDAILMDIRMPVMDGITAAKAIRASSHPDAASVPIIAMTANAFDDDMRASMEAGMNAHLSKPIDTALLYDTLAHYMMR